MTTVRNLLSSIWPDSQRTAAMASSNSTALPTSSRHPHYATYYDLLSTALHGTPLWLPEPNETQHINYRRQGAAIGDVVILTDNGGLHLLFNICLDADDPINGPNDVPEGFSPFKPALRVGDVTRFREYGEDSYLASKAITKKRDLQGPAGLWFESSAAEGAILAMPEGAYSEDLARKDGFDRYLEENLDSWYHYINDVREFGIEQGQLRLVTGVHKAKAWGIATFSNERAAAISDLKMVFKSNEDTSSGALYSWEFRGNVDSSRSGPTRKQREDVFGGRPPLENQCLFVRTVNASSRKVKGKNRESYSISVPTSQIDIRSRGLEPSESAGPSNYTSSSSQDGRFVQNQMGAQYSLPIEQNGPVLRDHPSKAIIDFLLEEKPSARIAITHDEDWMSLLTDDDVSLPSGDELVARLKKSCKITEHGGVVSLEFDASVCVSMEEMGKSNGISIGGGELHRAVTGDSYIPAGRRPSHLQFAPYKSHSDRFSGNAQRSFPTVLLPSLPQLPDVHPEKNSASALLQRGLAGFASQNSIPVENAGNSASFAILTSPSMSRPKKLTAGMAATVDRLETLPTVQNTLKSISDQGELAFLAGSAATAISILQIIQSIEDKDIDGEFVNLALDACGLVYIVIHQCSENIDRSTAISRDMRADADELEQHLKQAHTFFQKKAGGSLARRMNPRKRHEDKEKIAEYREDFRKWMLKFGAGSQGSVHNCLQEIIDRKINEREQHTIAARKAKENATLESLGRITADMGNIRIDDASSSRVNAFTPTKQPGMPEPPTVYSTPAVITISDTHHDARPIDVGLPIPTPAALSGIRDDVEKTHRSEDWYAMRRAEKERWRKSEQEFADLPPATPDNDEPPPYPVLDIFLGRTGRLQLEEEQRGESFHRPKGKKVNQTNWPDSDEEITARPGTRPLSGPSHPEPKNADSDIRRAFLRVLHMDQRDSRI